MTNEEKVIQILDKHYGYHVNQGSDMWYAERIPQKIEGWNLIQNGDAYYYLSLEKPSKNNFSIDIIKDIPCWSLGALISLLPEVISIHNGGNYFLAMNNKSIQYYSKEDHKHEIYFESVITQALIESVVNQEKQLLLQDLCARLPYGVKGKVETTDGNGKEIKDEGVINSVFINEHGAAYICIEGMEYELDDVKPYLRPMSSMTDEEFFIYKNTTFVNKLGFCLRGHWDFHELIPKGLALEAPEGMYNTKTE
jgi:hypothetical protein